MSQNIFLCWLCIAALIVGISKILKPQLLESMDIDHSNKFKEFFQATVLLTGLPYILIFFMIPVLIIAFGASFFILLGFLLGFYARDERRKTFELIKDLQDNKNKWMCINDKYIRFKRDVFLTEENLKYELDQNLFDQSTLLNFQDYGKPGGILVSLFIKRWEKKNKDRYFDTRIKRPSIDKTSSSVTGYK